MKRELSVPAAIALIVVALVLVAGAWLLLGSRETGVYVDSGASEGDAGGPGWKKGPKQRGNR